MSTNVPSPSFGDNGFVAPAESAILAGVQTDQNAAFGGDLNPGLTTPQGQLATSLTAIIGNKNDQFLELANGVDPAFASGRMQDAIARIYFIERNPATPTAVVATCTGRADVVIPVGAMAKASDGNLYICTEAGTISVGGSIGLNFACAVTGPIACPVGSLNQIYQSIPGWDTINNAGAGTVGSNVESRADFEYRRKQSVALNAVNSLQSIYAAVFNITDVIDVYATENTTSSPIVVGGQTLVEHSIYIAVVGGTAADVAKAIWDNKSLGANYNGNTSFTVTDTAGYDYPYPSYNVTWETPGALPILFAVEIANNPGLPSNIVALVQAAIIASFNGTDGGARARIGSTIFASRFYGNIVAIGSTVSILSLLLGPTTATLASYTVPINNTPTISAANISVTLV